MNQIAQFFKTSMVVLGFVSLIIVCRGCGESSLASGADNPEPRQYYFVVSAQSGTFNGSTMILEEPSKATLFFSDRPYRQAGHILTEDFINDWGSGINSFAADPPNAAFATQELDADNAVIEMIDRPVLADGKLTMKIRVLEGAIPGVFDAATLFIDTETGVITTNPNGTITQSTSPPASISSIAGQWEQAMGSGANTDTSPYTSNSPLYSTTDQDSGSGQLDVICSGQTCTIVGNDSANSTIYSSQVSVE